MTADSEHPQMTRYLAQARWFGGKGREYDVVAVERVATLPGPPVVTIDVLRVSYTDGGAELYQMPLSHYPEEQERIAHAYLGSDPSAEADVAHTYDAVHDREAMAVYLDAFDQTPVEGAVDYGELTFHRLSGHELDTDAHSTLFSGEQSNSSVAFGDDSLLKVFRKVTPGRNPDIEIHAALTAAENPNVAALYGWVEGSTSDGRLDLAMIQQFLRTASDGWDLALSSVRNLFAEADLHADEVGGDFAGEAERLGAAVAEVHEVLREHFPTQTWSGPQLGEIADGMRARFEAQLAVAPELAEHRDAVLATYARLADLHADVLAQRIHGDLHLGQTLRVVHNWKLVDFEGEPAKPLAERVLPDSPWRDVAGMLRSFDYAARAVERDLAFETGDDAGPQLAFRATEWTHRNRQAFLDGYLGGTEMTDQQHVLVAAYETDKAVYEVGYETRNRPAWVTIPLGALARLGNERHT